MSAILFRSLLVLGIISFMAILIFAEAGPIQPFQPVIPTFVNPFDEGNQVNRFTSVPTTPIRNTTGSAPFVTWVGCSNTTSGRQFCVNSNDFDRSYFQVNFTNDEATAHGFLFNITNRALQDATENNIRRYILTISCRTETGERPAIFEAQVYGVFSVSTLVCPFGDFHRIVFDKSTPGGIGAFGPGNSDGQITFRNSDDIESGTPYEARVQLSFVMLEVIEGDTTSGTGCESPEGAWFPWADEIACAIGQFGQIVWKFILLTARGFIYIGEWFVTVGQYILNYLAVIVWLYSIPGMPLILQGFVDVFVTVLFGAIAIEIFRLLKPFGD